MIKQSLIIALILLSCSRFSLSLDIDYLLNEVFEEEAVKDFENTHATFDPNQTVTHANPDLINGPGDEDVSFPAIKLPYSMTDQYYRPKLEQFTSVQDYWEKEIFFAKLDGDISAPSYALQTDKPVYRPGETLSISVLFFDKFSRTPLTLKATAFKELKIVLLDGGKQKLSEFNLSENLDSNASTNPIYSVTEDQISSIVQWKLATVFKGGFYTLELSSENLELIERANFFVSSYRNENEKLILDFNKDALMADDDLVGKVTLKLLGNSQIAESSTEELKLWYQIQASNGTVLHTEHKKMKQLSGYILYRTPKDLEGVTSLSIVATVDYNGRTLTASKQLSVVDIDSLRVDFTPGGGKYTRGFDNTVFFQAYGDVDRSLPIQIENAKVIEICYATVKPIQLDNVNNNTTDGMPEPALEEPEELVAQANQKRVLEKDLNQEAKEIDLEKVKSTGTGLIDRLMNYFTKYVDQFLGFDPSSNSVPSQGEHTNENNPEANQPQNDAPDQAKTVLNEAGFLVAQTNNYYRLPQSEYQETQITEKGKIITERISSNDEGKGSFQATFSPDCSYYLQVQNQNYLKKFMIVNTATSFFNIDQSDFLLKIGNTVLQHGEDLSFEVHKSEKILATHYRFVVINKGKVLKEEVLEFKNCADGVCVSSVKIAVGEFDKQNGGVFTLQVYREKMYDSPEQESLIFVYPEKTVSVGKSYEKTAYRPGETVNLNLKFDGKY